MRKLLFLIPALFLLFAFTVSASYSENPYEYVFWDSGDEVWDGTTHYTPVDGTAMDTTIWTSSDMYYDDDGAKYGNMSIASDTGSGNSFILSDDYTNTTVFFSLYDDSSDTSGRIYVILSNKAGDYQWYLGIATAVSETNYFYQYYGGGNSVASVARATGWHNWTIEYGTDYSALFIDDVLEYNDTAGLIPMGKVSISPDPGTLTNVRLDFVGQHNGTRDMRPEGALPNLIPPEITFYNMTSNGGGGCTVWNYSKSNACDTSDTTPTVVVHTNQNSHCAIGVSDLNYTGLVNLGNERICSGAETKEHTCTLVPDDELTGEISYIYIGCKNTDGYENSSSTSSALKVSIHSSDLESYGRNAIEAGIQSALPSSYTIYTDQKIYARNSANGQSVGVFDKVVKWMNKIWAFNFLTGNDTYVNMFNITPVLYTLEMYNTTNSTVNSTVYQFILDTK